MKVLALTGGIASGKSSALDLMRQMVPEFASFDADASARHLLSQTDVIDQLACLFPEAVVEGKIDRSVLRQIIFSHPPAKQKLESLLHPLIRKECLASLAQARKSGEVRLFVADIPLFYENQFHFGQEYELLIAAEPELQIHRLQIRNGWQRAEALAVIEAQMSLVDKIQLSKSVIWNQSGLDSLQLQLKMFLKHIGIEN
ncbi:dephospho-CoA kinase [Persicirhabdus sediminis]|nr:dephospho-CoA kinase [Persicirhabdus sediminis]